MSSSDLARNFFEALKARDSNTIATYYTLNAVYSNAVYPGLSGFEASKMWQMMMANAKVFGVDYKILKASGKKAKVAWLFSYTSRKNRNFKIKVTSFLEFEDNKIYTHEDRFNFGSWVRQTHGLLPWIFQFTGITKKKIQEKAEHDLNKFIQNTP